MPFVAPCHAVLLSFLRQALHGRHVEANSIFVIATSCLCAYRENLKKTELIVYHPPLILDCCKAEPDIYHNYNQQLTQPDYL